jgi:hypothetical protein
MHQISAPTGDTTAADALDTQLSAYGQRAARRRRKAGAAEVLGYTAAAGGLAFAGGDALGAIVHNTTAATFTVTDGSATGLVWDIDGSGGQQNVILARNQVNDSWAGLLSGAVASGEAFALVNILAPGANVGPTLATGTFNTGYGYFAQGNSTTAPFLNTTAYFGFRFNGTTGTAGTQYGWAKARVDRFGANDIGVRLTISEWAYDNSGAPICVGDTGSGCGGTPVPVPGTPLLTLLGLGAVGLSAYRRRREAGLKRLAAEQEGAAA